MLLLSKLAEWATSSTLLRGSRPPGEPGTARATHWFFTYACAYCIALFWLVFYVPINDFDSMSSYLARIKLEEFGPLEHTATLSIQYLFPKSFDYLHKPFLLFGYFEAMPSFCLFVFLLLYLLRQNDCCRGLCVLILCFGCQPLLVTSTAAKNDLGLGIVAFAALTGACRITNPTIYQPLSLLLLAWLVGIKWHGILLASLIGAVVAFRTYRETLVNLRAFIFVLGAMPLYWIASSGDVYLNNILRDGSATPIPAWLASSQPPFILNCYRLLSVSVFETLTIAWFCIEQACGIDLMPLARRFTAGGYQREFSLMPSCDGSAFGACLLFALAADIYVVASSRFRSLDKIFATVALGYCIGITSRVYYTNWNERYLLAGYILSVPPAVAVLARHIRHAYVRYPCVVYALFISLHALFCTAERRLVPLIDRNGANYVSIFASGADRESLRFHTWSGYKDFYGDYRGLVESSHSLLVLNNLEGGEVPFIYPFIRSRSPSNTAVHTPALRANASLDENAFDYILVFKGGPSNTGFERVLHYPGAYEVSLYKKLSPGRSGATP
jgi:hypothetical protein